MGAREAEEGAWGHERQRSGTREKTNGDIECKLVTTGGEELEERKERKESVGGPDSEGAWMGAQEAGDRRRA